MCDGLYVALDKWDDFVCKPYDRGFELDLFERVVNNITHVKHIAIPEVVLRNEVASLHEMFGNFPNLKVLFIVIDAQPDLQFVDNDTKVQQRWEFESTQGKPF